MKRLLLQWIILLLAFVQQLPAQSEIALKPGDKIVLSIGGVPTEEAAQINNSYSVSEDGNINLLHLSAIRAAGLTASQLGTKIMQQYREREIYTNPNVTINTEVGETTRLIYVDGYVNKPGPVPYRPGLTASNALATAGGKDTFGRLKKVRLTRVTEDGQTQIYTLDLTKPGNADSQTQLLPNDTLSIPN
jgi:polysaccharide biosynthesis/export protein